MEAPKWIGNLGDLPLPKAPRTLLHPRATSSRSFFRVLARRSPILEAYVKAKSKSRNQVVPERPVAHNLRLLCRTTLLLWGIVADCFGLLDR